MDKKTILAAFAHPDDEAFATGGTISRYAARGYPVTLVCATRGEAGEISDPKLATPENLGIVRENELRCAAEQMGIKELIFLDYRDSGMAGTPENEDPRAYINAPDEEVVPKLVAIIRRVKPAVVVTFEPYGGYGHPDHKAIHRHTVEAFFAAADPAQYPDLGSAWQAERLFYSIVPGFFMERMRAEMEALGEDTSDLERFEEGDQSWPDDQIHVKIPVSSSVDQKWDALNCHRTQFGPDNLFRRIPEVKAKEMMSSEYFALAWPEPEPGLETDDLFSDTPTSE